jgi:hypothetical protein
MIVECTRSAARWAGCLALLPLFTTGSVAAADRGSPLVEHVRTVNDRFKDVSVATSEGYAWIVCVSGIEGGAMGVYHISTKLLSSDVIDLTHSQAVMYEPTPDGRMALIAVNARSLVPSLHAQKPVVSGQIRSETS